RRHEARPLLVRGDDQRNLHAAPLSLLLVVQEDGVVGRQDGPAAIAEDGVDALVRQHLHDHPRSGQGLAGKRVPGGAGLGDGVAHAELSETARSCGRWSWEPSRSVCGTKGGPWPLGARSFILLSIPSPIAPRSTMRHIIAILLQNEAGALSMVAGLFSTRGYKIESLSVA